MKDPESLVDLAVEAGPNPEGVSLATWLIAQVPPAQLTRAAKYVVPSHEQLAKDKRQGGDLIKYIDATPLPEKSLGEDILLHQQKLSRFKRGLGVAACSLALFAGIAGLTDAANTSADNGLHIRPNTTSRLESDAIAGGIGGAAGGFVALFAELGLAGRLARRPAQKIVRQASQGTK